MDTPQSIIEFSWGSSRMTHLLSPSTVETGKISPHAIDHESVRTHANVMGSIHCPPEKEGRTRPRQLTTAFLNLPRNCCLREGGSLHALSSCVFAGFHIS